MYAAIIAVVAASTGAFALEARADEISLSPHIDQLRRELNEQDAPKPTPEPQSFIESERKKLEAKDAESGAPAPASTSYTEELRKRLDTASPPPSYTEQERIQLAPKEEGGAIQAVHEGRSALIGKRTGTIHHAAGLRVGGSLNREITGSAEVGTANFEAIYGDSRNPDVTLFYEYQPWHSEWFGSLGLVASLGVGIFKGTGVFAVNLTSPNGTEFGTTSRVSTQLFDFPLTVGLSYRLNVLRILRPFVMVGPTLIGFYETRSDGQNSHYASARGISFSGGVSILLDWVSKGSSWELYANHGIKHYYLTVQYDRLSTFSGPVTFATSGLFGGLAFEF